METSLHDHITIKNIDDEPFNVVYDKELWATLEPGETRTFPRFLANHAVKHLIDRLINKQEPSSKVQVTTGNISLRDEWAQKIVIEQEKIQQPIKASYHDQLRKDIERANKSDLERLEKIETKQEEPSENGVKTNTTTQQEDKKPKEENNLPSREKLLAWGREQMGIDTENEETKAAFSAMNDQELAEAVQYGS